MRYYIRVAVVIILLLIIGKAFGGAGQVPDNVKAEVTQYPLAHQGGCIFQQAEVPCQIFYNEKDEVIYLVIYANDLSAIVKVVKVKDKKETILWLNPLFNA